jgi:hypothetical protein
VFGKPVRRSEMQVTEKRILEVLGSMALTPETITKQIGVGQYRTVKNKDGNDEQVVVKKYPEVVEHVRVLMKRLVRKEILETLKQGDERSIRYKRIKNTKVTQGRKCDGSRRDEDAKPKNVPHRRAVQESAPKDQGSSEQA